MSATYAQRLEAAAAEVRTTATVLAQIEAQGNDVPEGLLGEWISQHGAAFDAARAAERRLTDVALGGTEEPRRPAAGRADAIRAERRAAAVLALPNYFPPETLEAIGTDGEAYERAVGMVADAISSQRHADFTRALSEATEV